MLNAIKRLFHAYWLGGVSLEIHDSYESGAWSSENRVPYLPWRVYEKV
jgi:hypothetical protein